MLKNLEIALNEALQDEYKACETYRLVMQKFGAVRPFINIMGAEQRHIQALLPLFRKYQIPIPINQWNERNISIPNTLHEACLMGVQAEIENGEMYHKLLELSAGYPDVQSVFRNLQRASQENHLRAFQRSAGLPVNPVNPSHAGYNSAQTSDRFAAMNERGGGCGGGGRGRRHRGGR